MAIGVVRPEEAFDEVVRVLRAGADVAGEFYCASCGYGIAVRRTLPTCPMCGGEAWEDATARALVRR